MRLKLSNCVKVVNQRHCCPCFYRFCIHYPVNHQYLLRMKNHLTGKANPSLLKGLLLTLSVVFSFTIVNDLTAQNTLDRAGLTVATPASVAYSLRKLSNSYTGFALQIRRSSDNTTQDIGFTAGGHLDTVSLKAFVGSGNGFVVAW